MLALATPALHNEPLMSWHHAPARRPTVRSHSSTQQYFHHHDQPPHQSLRLSRSTSTPVHEPIAAASAPAASVSVSVLSQTARVPDHSQQSQQTSPAADSIEKPAAPRSPPPPELVDLQAIPPKDLIKHLANLLQQIAAANDALPQPDIPHRLVPADEVERPQIWHSLTSAARGAFGNPTSALAFHARNIPSFPLEAYLLRILKYCPIPNEVFLSLLVYFDRMTRLARETTGAIFAIDSYNVHRLVIAGVTVASKFLSDVFYTNTRYAKVGGLPRVEELNQLELQFLLLNNFNLVISQAEMQKYARDLMAFANASILPAILADPASYKPQPQQQSSTWSDPRDSAADQSENEQPASDAGDYTTDDEPTIRAAHSSASSETQSIFTVTSEDTDADRDPTDDDDDDDDDDNAHRRGLFTPSQ
ncbi:cyclin-domain-containing protein [Auriculariales sp. MPI-PUGE-AT-0066]|nr:cyclin-domain-containing protein [Auriculariales sp. MPI-PUGE-AT-0066]